MFPTVLVVSGSLVLLWASVTKVAQLIEAVFHVRGPAEWGWGDNREVPLWERELAQWSVVATEFAVASATVASFALGSAAGFRLGAGCGVVLGSAFLLYHVWRWKVRAEGSCNCFGARPNGRDRLTWVPAAFVLVSGLAGLISDPARVETARGFLLGCLYAAAMGAVVVTGTAVLGRRWGRP